MEYNGCCNNENNEQIDESCKKTLAEINCEFVGLALQNSDGPNVKWHYTIGNSNEKYKRITVRYGKGIAGKVISTGRPIMLADFPNNIRGKVLEYPIMLAENLLNAYAVPIHFKGVPKGVLLAGKRKKEPFSQNEKNSVLQAAKKFEEKLYGNRRK